MKRLIMLALLLGTISACNSIRWSATPYGQVGDAQGDGKYWQAGFSMTFYDKVPAQPAVPYNFQQKLSVTQIEAGVDHGDHDGHDHKKHKHGKKGHDKDDD